MQRRPLAALGLALGLAACHPRPAREWRPEDHDSGVTATSATTAGPVNDDPLAGARALFTAQCASCHGPQGHGDGPMAAMFRPADLSDGTLQSTRTDEMLSIAITSGRGRMPAFGANLRPEAVSSLVRLIRTWRR